MNPSQLILRLVRCLSLLVVMACGSATNAPVEIHEVSSPDLSEKLCAGTSIFGRTGSAVCMHLFDGRLNAVGYPLEKKIFLNLNSGGDGYAGSTGNLMVNRAILVNCGASGSIADREQDCRSKNGAEARWDGAVKSNVGVGVWTLITRQGVNGEVWRDERTRLLWSGSFTGFDNVPASGTFANFCQAAGLAGAQDPAGVCANVTYQPNQTNPRSICAEGSGRTSSLSGENWNTRTYSPRKGNMGLTTLDAPVEWWLPTREDYLQGMANGMGYVLPLMTGNQWTSTILHTDRTAAIFIYFPSVDDSSGVQINWAYEGIFTMGAGLRSNSGTTARCAGRPL